MAVKYQVFVSSTYEDLITEREFAIKTVLKMGHIPVGMEMFNAADEEQWKVISRRIDESDYYVLLVAHRYGSQVADGTSYTEKEYDYALSKGIPILGFIIDDTVKVDTKFVDDGEKKGALNLFKDKIKLKTIEYWKSADGLQGQIAMALTAAMDQIPRKGWVRPDESNSQEMGKEITRLSGENSRLREELEKIDITLHEQENIEVNKIEAALNSNLRPLSVWNMKKSDWKKNAANISLMEMFLQISHDLMDESSEMQISKILSWHISKPEGNSRHSSSWPVPRNKIKQLLGEISVFDLIEPSKKKHTLKDENIYWSLTEEGRVFNKIIRRRRLEKGIEDSFSDTSVEDENKDDESSQ